MINKEKNVMIQVTFPKEDAEHLNTLQSAFAKDGVKVTKSEILVHSLREYIKALVYASKLNKAKTKSKKQVEKPQGGKVNA